MTIMIFGLATSPILYSNAQTDNYQYPDDEMEKLLDDFDMEIKSWQDELEGNIDTLQERLETHLDMHDWFRANWDHCENYCPDHGAKFYDRFLGQLDLIYVGGLYPENGREYPPLPANQAPDFDAYKEILKVNYLTADADDNILEIQEFSNGIVVISSGTTSVNPEINLILDTPQTVNSFGVPLDSISVNNLVMISANIDNLLDAEQNFFFQIKITDSDEGIVKEQWISGMISAQKRMNSSISWTPEKGGTYTVIASVGNGIDSLNYHKSINVEVSGYTPVQSCKEGQELIFKTTDGSPACVKPTTAEMLIQRGWATSS